MLRIHLAPHAWSITCVCKLLAPTVRPQTVIAVLCANVYSVESVGRCAFTGAHDRLMDGVISLAVRVCARDLCLFGIYMNIRARFRLAGGSTNNAIIAGNYETSDFGLWWFFIVLAAIISHIGVLI